MTPLPGALGGRELIAWRLEAAEHLSTWDAAEGAFRVGGRWNSPGRRVLYAALDPATAILEVAVHKGFDALDVRPHVLISLDLLQPARVHRLDVAQIPNAHWMRPGAVSRNQQAFGDRLLAAHPVVVLPSVVSTHSWNLLVDVGAAAGAFKLRAHERFSLDTRLTPPPA